MNRKNNLLLIVLLFLTACNAPSPKVESTNVDEIKDQQPTILSTADQLIIDKLLSDMVLIPVGQFSMGDNQGEGEDDELPVHEVSVSSFSLARHEVTFEQYDVFVRATDGELPKARWGLGRQPVMDVTWHDAIEFTQWLSQLTQKRMRLPTEAEWEYAARAGNKGSYSFGDSRAELCQYANIADQSTDIGWRNKQCDDGYLTTAPVGSFKANAFGLYDMHGNVWEWTADCWFKNYKSARSDSLLWSDAESCSARAQRGGSWFYGADEARAAYRTSGKELEKSVNVGFRVAQDID